MLWILYNSIFTIGYLAMLPYFIFRMCRRGGYLKGFMQRFCVFKPNEIAEIRERRRIWIHAVSVGEVKVAFKFMETYRAAEPDAAFFLTTTTSTAHALAGAKIRRPDFMAYFPVDFPFVMRREFDLVRPTSLMLVEGELWPNMIRFAAGRGIPVFLVNGRVSEKSARGYGRARMFFKCAINMFQLLCVQSDQDAVRLKLLGAAPDLIRITGSAKYDEAGSGMAPSETARAALDAAGMGREHMIILGGSTWPGEEAILLDIFKRLRAHFPLAKLVLVPRHAERAAAVESEIRRTGLSCARRKNLCDCKQPSLAVDVLLVDTTGELTGFYSWAGVVFVGKSLTKHGGQNIIEPAVLSKPVLIGPNMENFSGIVADFIAEDAVLQVNNAGELETALRCLLSDSSRREALGRNAARTVEIHRGAIAKTVSFVREA